MNPYLEMRERYLRDHGHKPMTWEELVGWHLQEPQAYVMKTPEVFVMGRAVISAAGDKCLDLRVRFAPASCDAWLLYAFAGDMRKAWALLPYPLPMFGWHRSWEGENSLRFYPQSRIEEFTAAKNG